MSSENTPIKKRKHEYDPMAWLHCYFYAGDVDNVLRILDEEKIAPKDMIIYWPGEPDIPRSMLNEAARMGNTRLAVELAKRHGGVKICSCLYRRGIALRPIRKAIRHGKIDFLREFLLHYDDEEKMGNISLAAQLGYFEVVKLLVESGVVDVDELDCNEKTALLNACATGRNDIAKYLLANGADVNGNDSNDTIDANPFFVSVELGNYEMVDLLLATGEIHIKNAHIDEDEACSLCTLNDCLDSSHVPLPRFKKTLDVLKKHLPLAHIGRGITFLTPYHEILFLESIGGTKNEYDADSYLKGDRNSYILRDRVGIVQSLLNARKCPASPLHEDAFALDVFKIIFKMCWLFLLEDER